jgi:NAD(P)H-quinone oxidoreductase subunit 5
MSQSVLSNLVVLSPLIFTITAFFSHFQQGIKPKFIKKMAVLSTIISLLISVYTIYLVANYNMLETSFFGINGIGFSLRIDVLSATMLTMISLLSFVIFKFSLNYLDGDSKQGSFLGRLAATTAAVQLFVLSGNLGVLFVCWVLTSITLHRLLVFYSNRPGAIVAARKKFIFARIGDSCLLAAFSLLYINFGTGNLEFIFNELRASSTALPKGTLELIVFFLAFAAILKSAQFPFHGWLIEVMETPTPVSALLHAGLLNAGPFLIIRMAFIVNLSDVSSIIIITVGGFTALFASMAYLTQTSIKTALGYSSVAHMGFSLLLCGLGGYSIALLHLVAHSFYKAHAFLSSGSVIDVLKVSKNVKKRGAVSSIKIIIGIGFSLLIYLGCAYLWKVNFTQQFPLFIMGGIVVAGMSTIFISIIVSDSSIQSVIRAIISVIAITLLFFTLESIIHSMILSQVPNSGAINNTGIIVAMILLISFGFVFFIQLFTNKLKKSKRFYNATIHLKNGFYVNALLDRLIGAQKIKHSMDKKQFESN